MVYLNITYYKPFQLFPHKRNTTIQRTITNAFSSVVPTQKKQTIILPHTNPFSCSHASEKRRLYVHLQTLSAQLFIRSRRTIIVFRGCEDHATSSKVREMQNTSENTRILRPRVQDVTQPPSRCAANKIQKKIKIFYGHGEPRGLHQRVWNAKSTRNSLALAKAC